MLDGIELIERSIDKVLENTVQAIPLHCALTKQLEEVIEVAALQFFAVLELRTDFFATLLRQLPLIQRLHRTFAGDVARPRETASFFTHVISWPSIGSPIQS